MKNILFLLLACVSLFSCQGNKEETKSADKPETAIAEKEYLDFWGVRLNHDSYVKLDSALVSKGYKKCEHESNITRYEGLFDGRESYIYVFTHPHPKKGTIAKPIAIHFYIFDGYLEGLSPMYKRIREQLKKRYPKYDIIETGEEGSSSYTFSLQNGANMINTNLSLSGLELKEKAIKAFQERHALRISYFTHYADGTTESKAKVSDF